MVNEQGRERGGKWSRNVCTIEMILVTVFTAPIVSGGSHFKEPTQPWCESST